MKNYTYQNTLVSKKQLKQILAWSFSKYGSVQACFLADELKYLGFKYATQAGISISIEDLRVPYIKDLMLIKANKEITNAEKSCLKGKITAIEKFQKIIDTWNITSESLKDEVVSYFKKYDPLNSVYMMAFSGARGNLSQVRQLVGMRGLMSDPSGQIMNLPIKKNFREGLTITDYLMSGYGARKGIVDTALKTANSGYLTRRLIDVAQDIIIREKDCLTPYSFLFNNCNFKTISNDKFYNQLLGRLLNKPVYDPKNYNLIADINTQITNNLIRVFKQKNILDIYIRSPLTCCLYRSVCQKCYGWNLAKENIVDLGEAIGIIAGQSIGEPGTQLTMRTFHTGGIFTSAASQQLISPINGLIEFSKFLKTSTIRTNRGENVLLTENSGFLTIFPDNQDLIQVELPRNTILFIKNNQYIKKNTIIGQLSTSVKQTVTENKYILSNMSGEVFMPSINLKQNTTTVNKILWLLAGQVYSAPINSFLNFSLDYKINKNNFVFRSKIINPRAGYIQFSNDLNTQSHPKLEILNTLQYFENITINKLFLSKDNINYLLYYNNLKYFLNNVNQNAAIPNSITSISNFANLVTNKFKTLTGGTPYYTKEIHRLKNYNSEFQIHFYNKTSNINYQTIIWLPEETYFLDCEKKFLLVSKNNFIPKQFEIISGIFSKTSGIISIFEKKDIVKKISIQSGSLYEIVNLQNSKKFANQVFYPGELILDHIEITQPSVIEVIDNDSSTQFLIRPLEIYEVPFEKSVRQIFGYNFKENSCAKVINCINYSYKSFEKILAHNSVELVRNYLNLKMINCFSKNFESILKIKVNLNKTLIKWVNLEKFYFTEFLPAYLKYTNLEFTLIAKHNQFFNSYTTLGYLQVLTSKSLEIVKLKSKNAQKREIFLISNNECITTPKSKLKNKTINQLLIDELDIGQTGKIIIDNGKFLTIQKGRPYFFPHCKNDNFVDETALQYKLVSPNILPCKIQVTRQKSINIHYYDISNKLITIYLRDNKHTQFTFAKMIIKKQGKLYISGVPILFRDFLIRRKQAKLTILSKLPRKILKNRKSKLRRKQLVFLQSSDLILNDFKLQPSLSTNFASVLFFGYPFPRIGIHSVTEDFFEQEVNSIYCKNGEFIENGQTIGLLNFEKEITGDIVQGLPRVEELLEARKKKKLSKQISKNQKKSLLIRKTSLDPSFEFRKLGKTIKNNERINPHNLLKVYFNYYAKVKILVSENRLSQSFRLTTLYEASYRSFKKVQLLILSSIQSVYQSQGVVIADKHLEIIIKQMTSKVQITRSGDTPLLPHEIIDLYHIKYINQVISSENSQPAYYIPLLLGVTKAALNNPSFISAASFQETTSVLTKAAIEGRCDWLRGLKENIVIGQLIPAGTGLKTYSEFFTKNLYSMKKLKINSQPIKTFSSKL